MADTPSIIAGITREMKHLAERQRVIAQNIANGETAGYKAQEVEAPDFSDLLARQGIARGAATVAKPRVALTAGMTALGARPPTGAAGIVADHDTAETKPDGNNVSVEEQLLKMGRIQSEFAAMTNLYRKQQMLLKIALGRGGA